MRPARAPLAAVPSEPPPEPVFAKDIYAEARRAGNDRELWRRMHERSDRGPGIRLPDGIRRLFAMGGGIRRERGGFKFEERS
jgi:hypothetical protein